MTYPKFKLGEEVVREIAVPPTYGKVLCMLQGVSFYCYVAMVSWQD